jgi:phage gp36-like protein
MTAYAASYAVAYPTTYGSGASGGGSPSGLTPYALGTDLVKRYDIDLIGDLCQDNREELDWQSDITVLTEHVNVVSALEDASGEIEVAMQAGGRYTVDQLRELAYPTSSATNNNTRKHLTRITCAIAMSILAERRLDKVSMETADWLRKTAKAFLDQLRRGENVFGIQAHVEAGTIDISTVEAIQIQDLNLLTERMSRFFPGTEQRTPRAR